MRAGLLVIVLTIVLLTAFILTPIVSFAKQYLTLEKTWGGSGYDEVRCLVLRPSSKVVYVAGYSGSFGDGDYDGFIAKFDFNGTLIWDVTWGGDGQDYIYGIVVDGAENIYVVGSTNSFGDNYGAFIAKFRDDGTLVWDRLWGGSMDEAAYEVRVDASNYIYVVGTTRSFGGDKDVFLLKFDAGGDLKWDIIWGGAGDDDGFTLRTSGTKIYVAGATSSFGSSTDAFVARFTEDGELVWDRIWNGSRYERASDMMVDSNGNIILVGYTDSFGFGSYDVFVVKFDQNGNLLWDRVWGGKGVEYAMAGVADPSGNIYVAGHSNSFSTDYKAFIVKLDESGDFQWDKLWGGGGDDKAFDIRVYGEDIYIGGATFSSSRGLQNPVASIGDPDAFTSDPDAQVFAAGVTPTDPVAQVSDPVAVLDDPDVPGGDGFFIRVSDTGETETTTYVETTTETVTETVTENITQTITINRTVTETTNVTSYVSITRTYTRTMNVTVTSTLTSTIYLNRTETVTTTIPTTTTVRVGPPPELDYALIMIIVILLIGIVYLIRERYFAG